MFLRELPAAFGSPGAHGQRVLGGHDPAVAVGSEEAADDLLGLALVVLVGGVDEVAARLGERGEDAVALLLVGAEAPASPKLMVPRQISETRRPLGPRSL